MAGGQRPTMAAIGAYNKEFLASQEPSYVLQATEQTLVF